jgi:hypothetical protein
LQYCSLLVGRQEKSMAATTEEHVIVKNSFKVIRKKKEQL